MYLQSPRRIVGCLTILLVVLYSPLSLALESLGFTDLKKRVEQIETKDAYSKSTEELAKSIVELHEDLEDFIKEYSENVDVLILSVRLSFIEEVFVKSRSSKKEEILIKPESKFPDLHKRLDKAITLQPEYAAAYYWKAALYGMNSPVTDENGELLQKPIDLDKAIHFAQKAVILDEKNAWYRQTLAIYHVAAGDRKAALEVLDTRAMANNPVTILLKDLEAFPLPHGTIFSQEDSDSYIELQLKQKTVSDYPMLRVQVYVVPLSVTEMIDFYRAKWPGFKFFNQGRDDLYAQYMLLDADGMRPSADIGEARVWASQKMGGIIISVQEVKKASKAERAETPAGHKLPSNLGEHFSYLFYVNNRVVE